LTLNESGKFEDRWVHLQVVGDKCIFLRGIEQMYLPVAHAEGKFVARDEQTLQRLKRRRTTRSALCLGLPTPAFRLPIPSCPTPPTPTGLSSMSPACAMKRAAFFGLMPHPERHIDPTQHPRWTRERHERGDGLAVLKTPSRSSSRLCFSNNVRKRKKSYAKAKRTAFSLFPLQRGPWVHGGLPPGDFSGQAPTPIQPS